MRLILLFLLVSTSSFSLAQPIDRWVVVYENADEQIALNAQSTEPDVYYTHSMVLTEMRHNFKTGLLAGHTEYTFALFDCEHPRLQVLSKYGVDRFGVRYHYATETHWIPLNTEGMVLLSQYSCKLVFNTTDPKATQ